MFCLGFGSFPNIVTAMQMDRLVVPSRAYNSVLYSGVGKTPAKIS
jgi:heterodisulfide reductase subunit A-like polyferredoxin